jgi:excinuclease UvrABC nuclease subunit
MTRLNFRSVGEQGRYPEWVRELEAKSGAYVIRAKGGGEVLYVGESHANRLRTTITRHFQGWKRQKSFWAGFFSFGQQHDPGTTYQRGDVEVAVVIVRDKKRAPTVQYALIRKLKPRDNIVGQPDEDVPF